MANVIFNNRGYKLAHTFYYATFNYFSPIPSVIILLAKPWSKVKLIYRVTVERIVRMLRRKRIEKKSKTISTNVFICIQLWLRRDSVYGLWKLFVKRGPYKQKRK